MSTEEAYWAAEKAKKATWSVDDKHVKESAGFQDSPKPFTLDTSEDYVVQYLGTLSGTQRGTEEVVSMIDEAKRNGNVAWSASVKYDSILLILNKYGIKITDMNRLEVFLRLPMHEIGWAMHYTEDKLNSQGAQQVVVIEVGSMKTGKFKYYIYQCANEIQADQMCSSLRQAFEVVHSKAVLESL
eukprot:m.86271 g.86271  ORF g.86271 m.86271 type:complete len:185 (-) comp25950_c0_seq1:33-587(-)